MRLLKRFANRRRTVMIRHCGPYDVKSHADGKLTIHPLYPQFADMCEEGCGKPGLLTRMALAKEVEDLLNGI